MIIGDYTLENLIVRMEMIGLNENKPEPEDASDDIVDDFNEGISEVC